MIPKIFLTEWAGQCPWKEQRQVEQDLLITRALFEIYSQKDLFENLAFRGGTALNKLYFKPALRYSEDIDLVQTTAQPIGQTLTLLRDTLDAWLGEPKRNFSDGRVTLIHRILSEDGFPLKLKVEINSREHFSAMGFKEMPFLINSTWKSGGTVIKTYALEEMIGTKMRALYQRRKGRDLYDVYMALKKFEDLNCEEVVSCFHTYMKFEGKIIEKSVFEENMTLKLQNEDFCNDMLPLLAHNGEKYDVETAYTLMHQLLISRIS